jgi:hypothetical protein
MDLAAQLIQSQYTYTCSMIRKVEDKTFFQCNVDGSIYPSMGLCTANCKTIYACQQEQCLYQNMCSAYQVCPLGDYPCVNNSCTQTGTCSSTQVTTTQYQCPTNGQTYSDQTTCNNACLSYAAPIYNQTICTPTSWATGFGMPCCTCWNFCGPQGYFSQGYNQLYVNGGYQGLISGVPSCDTGCDWGQFDVQWASGGSSSYTLGRAESWELCKTYNACNIATGYTSEGIQYYYCTNSNSITCPSGYSVTTIDGKSVCQKGTSCVTQNTTTTKYQCSLTGTQYDTQSQCTSACLNTATCNTNYKCTYENSIYSDASTCQANCSFYQCPSDGAYYLTAPECQNACASFICQKDGVKFTSMYDCQLNCKEAGSCTAQ